MTRITGMSLVFLLLVFLWIPPSRAVPPDPDGDGPVKTGDPSRPGDDLRQRSEPDHFTPQSLARAIKRNLNTFFLLDSSESMKPLADYIRSFNQIVREMRPEGIGLRQNRIYTFRDSAASDRDRSAAPDFAGVKSIEDISFAHESGDRNYAEPLMRAFMKVLDEIEALEQQGIILPLQQKLLFIITDAGPNDFSPDILDRTVERVRQMHLRVYFVYPSGPGVRNPNPELEDNPAETYAGLEELVSRYEQIDKRDQAASFRRFKFESKNLLSEQERRKDFTALHRRLLAAIRTYIDLAFSEDGPEETTKEIVASEKTVPAVNPEPEPEPEPQYDRDSEVISGLREFKKKHYDASFEHFIHVLNEQIRDIESGGKKEVKGILATPVECRAELIFLIELERLKKENKDRDRAFMARQLNALSAMVENGEGLWVIVSEKKRALIQRRISDYVAGR